MTRESITTPECLLGIEKAAPPHGDQPITSTVDWQDQLIRNPKGMPSACLQNSLVALQYAPEWHGVLHFDESELHVVAKAAPPCDSRAVPFGWQDEDDVRTAAWM